LLIVNVFSLPISVLSFGKKKTEGAKGAKGLFGKKWAQVAIT
jgi:hypothetical protein